MTIEMLYETRGACCERSDREEEEREGGRCVNIVDGIVVVVVVGRRGQQGKEREEVSVIEPLMKKEGGREDREEGGRQNTPLSQCIVCCMMDGRIEFELLSTYSFWKKTYRSQMERDREADCPAHPTLLFLPPTSIRLP